MRGCPPVTSATMFRVRFSSSSGRNLVAALTSIPPNLRFDLLCDARPRRFVLFFSPENLAILSGPTERVRSSNAVYFPSALLFE